MSHQPTIPEQLAARREADAESEAERYRAPLNANALRGIFFALAFMCVATVTIGVPILVAVKTGSFLAGLATAAAELLAFAWATK